MPRGAMPDKMAAVGQGPDVVFDRVAAHAGNLCRFSGRDKALRARDVKDLHRERWQ